MIRQSDAVRAGSEPMYRRCIFCAADLGRNDELESFPAGRRLAFDPARGRLWVVCGRCASWNLSPLERRWEAIEEAESIYRGTRQRVSTPEIGLTRLPAGLELIRIGKPLLPEFAAWRYGDRFRRRRLEYVASTCAFATGLGAIALASPVLLGAAAVGGVFAATLYWTERPALVTPIRIPRRDGRSLEIRSVHHGELLQLRETSPGEWRFLVDHRTGVEALEGDEAVQALGLILPRLNWLGASPGTVREALSDLGRVDRPADYFGAVASRFTDSERLGALPRTARLALEMAAHEEAERHAMEEDLRLLELAWREAESIAAIADSLVLPERVRDGFDRLKGDRWSSER